MFTGLVETTGTISTTSGTASSRTLRVECEIIAKSVAIGDSVSVNGCCLTVVHKTDRTFDFEAGPETLRKTNLGQLKKNDVVNLEQAMRADGRFGGHLVQGHVDGVGRITSRNRSGEWEIVWFEIGALADELIPKGSITVDGVSLTVCDVSADAFNVMLIPHTLAATTLGKKVIGDCVNIETDVLGKYVRKYLTQISGGLSLEKLKAAGFVS